MRARLSALVVMIAVQGCTSEAPTGEPEPEPEPVAEETLEIYTVNYPLMYFAQRIGGDRVEVELPSPAGVDPASWSPAPDVVALYQGADLVLLNGADYARWVTRVTLPERKLVDTAAGIEDAIIVDEAAVTHSHGPEGEHSHAETASTVWLDLALATRQAEAIRDALVAARPESEAYFRERYESLASDLASLDGIVSPRPGASLLAAAPVYPYLARRYELDLRTFLYDPADMTGGDFWHEVEHALEDAPARLMLFERAPSAATTDRLKEMGVEVVVFDPCGAEPGPNGGDFLSVMKGNLERLREALEQG